LLIRKQAMKEVVDYIEDEIVVSANGYISRDLFNLKDRSTNFYMIGSMGLASSIGLGLAMKNPNRKIFVFDGDGNILMNLGSLTTIGSIKPKNFVHIIFDNSSHESTGGQPTNSNLVKIDEIAKSCNYNKVFVTKTNNELKKILIKSRQINGPIMILVKIKKGGDIGNRITIEPKKIKERFMKSLK